MIENLADALRLLVVTDDGVCAGGDLMAMCTAAVRGGATAVQLRLKRVSDADLLALARSFVATLPVPVFVNDRLDIAIGAHAAGVHLGPDDLAPALARRIAPAGFVIGASVGVEREIDRGAAADYWGIGPLRPSSSKGDAGPGLGLDGAKRLLDRAGDRACVLIGGVKPEDVPDARNAGFAGVAVIQGILGQADIEPAARRYRSA